ncbi:MAG TPA: polyprenyl synthetase family protein [Chloroflexota bacterium]
MTETVSIYGPVADDVPAVGEQLRQLSHNRHPLLGETLAHVFEAGGKRIRPALVLLSGRLGVYRRDELLTLATSVEAVHTATLVHDDTIDAAVTRRGLTTVSSLWDSKVAILLGDFLFAQSAELAARLDSVRIMTLLSETVMDMSSGELRQYASTRDRRIDQGDYFDRIRGKTASLFAMCCEGGAIVSDQTVEQVRCLREYGLNLGLAFQIVDDVLDFTSDDETLGKPAGNDLRQGTITLPAILLAEQLPSGSPILHYLRTGSEHDEVVRAVVQSEALDAALETARAYAQRAVDSLYLFPDSEAKEAMVHLADTVLERRR